MAGLANVAPALTCAGGMGLCMWLMSRRHGSGANHPDGTAGEGNDPEVAELRAEVARLRAEARSAQDQPAHNQPA